MNKGQKNEGKETAREETLELLKNKITPIPEDPLALESFRTKQTNVLSCFVHKRERD